MIIGFDLDNTLINYDNSIIECGKLLFPQHSSHFADRKSTKTFLQALPNGDDFWQAIQGMIYGPKILEATLFSTEIIPFFGSLLDRGHSIYIVSHKTIYSSADPQKTPLREAAVRWLEAKGFFAIASSFTRKNVIFAETRSEKVAIIKSLKCSIFVDDLIEVFEEPSFPPAIQKILLSAAPINSQAVMNCSNWKKVIEAIENGL